MTVGRRQLTVARTSIDLQDGPVIHELLSRDMCVILVENLEKLPQVFSCSCPALLYCNCNSMHRKRPAETQRY